MRAFSSSETARTTYWTTRRNQASLPRGPRPAPRQALLGDFVKRKPVAVCNSFSALEDSAPADSEAATAVSDTASTTGAGRVTSGRSSSGFLAYELINGRASKSSNKQTISKTQSDQGATKKR